MAVLVALGTGACGTDPPTFTPSGQAATPPTGSAVATAPSDGEVSAPVSPPVSSDAFELPEDFSVDYRARSASGDGGAALAAFGEFWHAWWSAIASHDKDRRYLDYLAPKDPLDDARIFKSVVRSWVTEGVRPIGTVRAHRFRVQSEKDGAVSLVGCGDESKVGTKDLASGKERWTFGKRADARYKMYVLMERDEAGQWRIRSYGPLGRPDPTERECLS